MKIDWLEVACKRPDEVARRAAIKRQDLLTKPSGALGRLEEIAIELAALQGQTLPKLARVSITIFAADHGVVAEGISAFPQAVTAEMVKNFARGGAAISVLARELEASLNVVNLGTVVETGPLDGVENCQLGPGTENFCQQAAMSEPQLEASLRVGQRHADAAFSAGIELFIGGEMGIGNTTSAAALAAALLGLPGAELAGPGTGLDVNGVAHKGEVIQRALERHGDYATPLELLRRLGGFEIAALVGALIRCGQCGLPVLIDGFIVSVAALLAVRISPQVATWFLYSHHSAEPGHSAVLEALKAKPLLDLGMRLGEGSGAAVAVPLLRAACALHSGMATFAEAGVSEGG